MNSIVEVAIRSLLFSHDCVIIPGFGGFILNYVPATIDKSSGMFFPPARRVSFNRNLTHNDGLLAGTISRDKEIGYHEAMDMIGQFTADLRRRLSKGEEVAFDLIGLFRTNREGSIQFEPDVNANYNPGSYGLEPIRCEPVAGYDVRKRVMKVKHEASPSHIPLGRLLVRAAVAIPVLIALVAVPLKTDIFGTRLERSSMNPLAKAEFEHNRAAIEQSSLAEVQQVIGTETVTGEVPAVTQPATAVPEVTEASETITAEPQPMQVNFYVIAGSFKSSENAAAMAGRLRTMGYAPELLEAPNGFTRVAAMGFADIETASAEMRRLAPSVEGLWILRK